MLNVTAGRRTAIAWWCPYGHRNESAERVCQHGGCAHKKIERHAQVHTSDRAVIYLNPATGERRTPPRADMPMPEVYVRQGFERHEIMSMTAYEKKTGVVHEASNFSPGSEPMPDERHPDTTCPKEVREALIRDVMDAHQSGAWTMDKPLSDGVE